MFFDSKKLVLILLIFAAVFGLQAVSAADINDTTLNANVEIDSVSSSVNNPILSGDDRDFELNMDYDDIDYGENATIVIEGPEDADGNFYISIQKLADKYPVYTDFQKGDNGVTTFEVPGLNAGSYSITAKLLNDTKYSSTRVFSVSDFTVYPIDPSLTATCNPLYVGDDAIVNISLNNDANGKVQVDIDGTICSGDVKNGVASVSYPDLLNGTYEAEIYYFDDVNYNEASISVIIEVFKVSNYTIQIITPREIYGGDNVLIEFVLPSDINGILIVDIDDDSYNVTIADGNGNLTINKVVKGIHFIDASFAGNDKYTENNNTGDFYAKAVEANITVESNTVKVGDDFILDLPSDAEGSLNITFGNVVVTTDVVNGSAVISTADVAVGVYKDAIVSYSGDDKYNSVNVTFDITVQALDYSFIVSAEDIVEGEVATITLALPSDISGNAGVNVSGKSYTVKVNAGNGVLNVSGLTYGTYNVIASYAGDAKYLNNSNSTSFKVFVKTPINVNISGDIIRGDNITINFPDDATGNVTVKIGNETIIVSVKDGKAVIPTDGLEPGNYLAEISYSGDSKYSPYDVSKNITVVSRIIITANDLTKYYSNPEKFVVKVMNSEGLALGNYSVTINLNGVNYTRYTNASGFINMGINLVSGVYNVTVTGGNGLDTAVINILPTVNGTDLVKVYRNATSYWATVRDANGTYLANGSEVEFNIHGIFYTRYVTGDRGLVRLNINLAPGEYIITARNLVTGEQASNNITVLPTIMSKDLTKYYRNASQYIAQLVSSDGKIVGAGETVTFNINGVFYTRQTNATGHVVLNINLAFGDYIITGEYGNCKVSNNIKVLPTLSGSDLTKKYGSSDAYEVKLVDGQGNNLSGKTITLNINGVFYNRVTDSNGIAKLNINLMPGRYIVTATYEGVNWSNTITVSQ